MVMSKPEVKTPVKGHHIDTFDATKNILIKTDTSKTKTNVNLQENKGTGASHLQGLY